MPYIGELSALGAALLWSFSSFLFTAVAIRIGTIQLNLSRMILASLFLIITIYSLNIDYKVSVEQLLYLSLSGFIGLVIGDTFLFRAYKDIGPRISILLMSINPAIAAIMAYFILNENLTYYAILGISITLLGIYLVVFEKKKNEGQKFKVTRLGIFFGIMAAVGQGVGLIYAKMAFNIGPIDSIVATFIRITAAIIIMLPAAIVMKKYSNPFKLYFNDRKVLGMVFIGSIIGPYLGIYLSFIAVVNTKVGIASTLMSTMPILMLPLARIFYKEKLSWKSILGAFIAVMGIALLFLK
jgi:drug/metabolite transporter (DMT)-like permease